MDEYIHVVVDQRGIDVAVSISGPDGKELVSLNGRSGEAGPENIFLVAPASGLYTLRVSPWNKAAPVGGYRLRVAERRNAAPSDRTRFSAQQTQSAADALCQRETPESRKEAMQKYAEAVSLWKELDDKSGRASSLRGLADCQSRTDERPKAIATLQEALALLEGLGDRGGQAETWKDIATAQIILTRRQEGLASSLKAFDLLQSNPNRVLEASIHNSIGHAYHDLGDYPASQKHFFQSLALLRPFQDLRNEAALFNNIGRNHLETGAHKEALGAFHAALKRDRQVGYKAGEAHTLHNLGSLWSAMGEKAKALESFLAALEIRLEIGDHLGESETLTSAATAYRELGQTEKAIETYEAALSLIRARKSPRGEARALAGRAFAERNLGRLESARQSLEEALRIVETARAGVARQELRASYLATVRGNYELYADVRMGQHEREPDKGHDRAALETSERARARSLIEILSGTRAELEQEVSPPLRERDNAVRQRLNAAIAEQARLTAGNPGSDALAAAAKNVEDLTEESRQVHSEIRAASPRYAELTRSDPLQVSEIQAELLDSDTLLLEYLLGGKRSFLWVVSPTTLHSFILPPRAKIEAAARRVHELFSARLGSSAKETASRRQNRLARSRQRDSEAARALSDMVLGPAAHLLERKRLILVTEGALQYVPFAALPDPSVAPSAGPVALVEQREIVNLPSASTLAMLRRSPRRGPPASDEKLVAVLADPVFDEDDERMPRRAKSRRPKAAREPLTSDLVRSAKETGALGPGGKLTRLPFTRLEAEAILKAAPSGTGWKVLDFAASRATAISGELSAYRAVHFATHALANDKHPELSGIVLSLFDEKGTPQDGFLRLSDIHTLRLPVDLVVLSACRTALGKEIPGEGLVGLTRGFLYAGAKRVVASLWEVDDEASAELMKRFYRHLFQGEMPPPAALRAAQRELAQQKRWRHPYYWASFSLQGEWR